MSDTPGGLDWRKDPDGKWYPPELPADRPAEAEPETTAIVGKPKPDLTPEGIAARKAAGGQGKPGAGCAGVVVLLVLLFVVGSCVSALGGDDSDGGNDAQELEYGAFDVCKQFVNDRLRSPATASYPNFFEHDGEVTVTNAGERYTVRSQVDSENGFGATLRTMFTCVVQHSSGSRFTLVSLRTT